MCHMVKQALQAWEKPACMTQKIYPILTKIKIYEMHHN